MTIKKAIVTGASSGLGRAIAGRLLENGAKVVNISRNPSDLPCENIPTDLTVNQSIGQTLGLVTTAHQDCDLLVSCAGVLHWADAGKNSADMVDADIAVNLTGMIKIVDGILPIVHKNSGDVIIIGSTSSFAGPAGSAIYNASKHGVLGYIKSLQTEFQDKDLRITGVYPGGFRSPFHIKAGSPLKQESLMDPNQLATLILSLVALPRNMQVSEIIINRRNVAAK